MEDVEMGDAGMGGLQPVRTDNIEFVSYRASIDAFFSNREMFERLQKIYDKRDEDVFPTIVYFVKHYELGRVRRTSDGLFVRITDMHSMAITSHKKRYYDFCSTFGKGEPVYNGKPNPYVVIDNMGDEVMLTLPCLVAIWWFIRHGLDSIFWEDYEDVKKKHLEHSTMMKRQYSTAHKLYNAQIKDAAIEKVIQNRDQTETPVFKTTKKKTILSTSEKKLVAEYIDQERTKRRSKQQAKPKGNNKKARKKSTQAVMLVGAGVFGEGEDDF